jgi:hypothetical protein
MEDDILTDSLMFECLKSIGKVLESVSRNKGNNDESRTIQAGKRHAFTAALRLLADCIDNPPTEATREPYPTKWLRKQFTDPDPDSKDIDHAEKGQLADWLPLHWLLTSSTPSITDIDNMLMLVGEHAYSSDVSPLSVALAKPSPEPQVLKRLLAYRPDSVSTPDKDGAYGLMYAAAWNDSELTLHALYQSCPSAMAKVDKYNFHALHYSAYVGCE